MGSNGKFGRRLQKIEDQLRVYKPQSSGETSQMWIPPIDGQPWEWRLHEIAPPHKGRIVDGKILDRRPDRPSFDELIGTLDGVRDILKYATLTDAARLAWGQLLQALEIARWRCPFCKGTKRVKTSKDFLAGACARCDGRGYYAECEIEQHLGGNYENWMEKITVPFEFEESD